MVLTSNVIVTSKIVFVCRKTAVTASNFDLNNHVYKFRELEYIYTTVIYTVHPIYQPKTTRLLNFHCVVDTRNYTLFAKYSFSLNLFKEHNRQFSKGTPAKYRFSVMWYQSFERVSTHCVERINDASPQK